MSLRAGFAVWFVLAGCGAAVAPVPCPSLPVRPHATMSFEPGLAGPGEYDVTAIVDGAREDCHLHLGAPRPAVRVGGPDGMVGMGAQDAALSCTSVEVSGFRTDGSLAGIEVSGTPATWSLRLADGGRVVVDAAFTPDYTPDACGFIAPASRVAVAR